MIHIQAKQHENPPEFLTVKLAPIDPIPESSCIRDEIHGYARGKDKG